MSGGQHRATQTSLTDRPDWRSFCAAAAHDLSLLERDPDGVLADVVGERSFREARYERISDELVCLFGRLSRGPILEVGGGYGGQALSIFRRHPAACYSIVDLPEPLRLQRAYLRHNGGYELERPRALPWLAVSNYALSETTAPVQRRLAARMAVARRGYIRWNGWVTGEVGLRELLRMLPADARALRIDDDREHNRLIVWGDE